MANLLSPTDCYYCRSNTNVQRFKFPCDCLIYAHPDCYKAYMTESRERQDGRWRLRCVQCNNMFTLPDYQAIQVNIQQDDEEMQPLTRKEMKREKCKICTILSVQSVVLTGLAAVVVWGYVKLIMGVF